MYHAYVSQIKKVKLYFFYSLKTYVIERDAFIIRILTYFSFESEIYINNKILFIKNYTHQREYRHFYFSFYIPYCVCQRPVSRKPDHYEKSLANKYSIIS
jgi:hypothetical protein